jgi:hypothetical protein
VACGRKQRNAMVQVAVNTGGISGGEYGGDRRADAWSGDEQGSSAGDLRGWGARHADGRHKPLDISGIGLTSRSLAKKFEKCPSPPVETTEVHKFG